MSRINHIYISGGYTCPTFVAISVIFALRCPMRATWPHYLPSMKTHLKYKQLNGVVRAKAKGIWGWAFALVAGIAASLILTFGGLQWVMVQVDAASDTKSGLITGVLGLGLVLIGPVLLFALAASVPQWWLASVKAHFRGWFLNGTHENRPVDP